MPAIIPPVTSTKITGFLLQIPSQCHLRDISISVTIIDKHFHKFNIQHTYI